MFMRAHVYDVFAVAQWEIWLLVSDWLVTPAQEEQTREKALATSAFHHRHREELRIGRKMETSKVYQTNEFSR